MAEWIRREGSKTRFRYVRADGRVVTDARSRERIRRLVIPPAWTDVHIAASASAEIQAWGLDAKRRKQYRYHLRAVERGQLRKYYRVRELARDLPRIRERVRAHAAARAPSRRAVAAAVVRLISESFFRVGGERYAAENGTFGITTLSKRHVMLVKGHAGEPYNIGIEKPEISMADLADKMVALGQEFFDYRGQRICKPNPEADYLTDNPNRRCPNISKARAHLGYDPTVLVDEGLRRSVIWYYHNREAEDA